MLVQKTISSYSQDMFVSKNYFNATFIYFECSSVIRREELNIRNNTEGNHHVYIQYRNIIDLSVKILYMDCTNIQLEWLSLYVHGIN